MNQLDINGVLKCLPHRYPFVLVDRVLDWEEGKSLVAIKNVTINEPFFPGHFPNHPIMPGVLTLEALAQATAVLAVHTEERELDSNTVYYFAGIDKARFKKPVMPGDQLKLSIEVIWRKRSMWKVLGSATVDGELAASAELTCVMKDV